MKGEGGGGRLGELSNGFHTFMICLSIGFRNPQSPSIERIPLTTVFLVLNYILLVLRPVPLFIGRTHILLVFLPVHRAIANRPFTIINPPSRMPHWHIVFHFTDLAREEFPTNPHAIIWYGLHASASFMVMLTCSWCTVRRWDQQLLP